MGTIERTEVPWRRSLFLTNILTLRLDLPGEKGMGRATGKPLTFMGSIFHRVIPGFMAQVIYDELAIFSSLKLSRCY